MFSQDRTFNIDKVQSEIQFKISHLGAFKVKGIFEEFSGKISFDEEHLFSVECDILVESINSDNEERDKIICEEAYLNTSEFPQIIFEATKFDLGVEDLEMEGWLIIKDVENTIKFPYDFTFSEDLKTVTLSAETQITRKEFNLIFGSMNGLIGNKVDIKLHIVATN